jgi:hypothetical protein
MSPRRRHTRSHPSRAHKESPLIFRIIKKVIASAVLFGSLLIVLFGFCWWMGDAIFELKHDANVVFVYDNLDGKEGKIYFVQFLLDEHQITVQSLDKDQSVNVIGGYGSYQLPKVYPLLKLEKKDSLFTRAALSWAVGGVVDQVVVLSDKEPTDKQQLVSILGSNIYRQGLDWENTALLAELYFFARSAPDELVTINTEPILLEKLSARVYQPVSGECTVAVVNTTPVPRLATRISGILESSGATVVRLDDSSTKNESSIISVDPSHLGCKGVMARMKSVFPLAVEQVDQPEVRREHRADVVLMLGNDLGEVVAE